MPLYGNRGYHLFNKKKSEKTKKKNSMQGCLRCGAVNFGYGAPFYCTVNIPVSMSIHYILFELYSECVLIKNTQFF